MGFAPGLHDQRANDLSPELQSSMKLLSNYLSHTAQGSPPFDFFCVSAMLSLLQRHTYMQIFVMNDVSDFLRYRTYLFADMAEFAAVTAQSL